MQLNETTIGIVGGGVVGSATAKSYSEHVKEVRIFDIDPKKANASLEEVLDSLITFVCLPTPASKDGQCDTTAIEQFFNSCLVQSSKTIFVIRSTVPIGYTKNIQHRLGIYILHSPEFLTARCATLDAQIPTRNIIGSTHSYGPRVLEDLYFSRWPHVPICGLTSDESEAVKLMTNSFFAVKVAFWNEMQRFASDCDMDWQAVMKTLLLDGRIHPSHTNVPGPDGKFGFGGACLPKDLANMVSCLAARGIQPHVTNAALIRNVLDRGRQY